MANSLMAPCGGLKIDDKTLGVNEKGELYVKTDTIPSGGGSSDDSSSTRIATDEEVNGVKDEVEHALNG